MARRRVVIIGAAGRDFHNFNTCFRDREACEVVAFTAAQIPGIAGRRYPPELAGRLYPQGIPIAAEADLPKIIRESGVRECIFAYSDVPYSHVMRVAALVNAAGASFTLLGPADTQLVARRPVIAVCAVRTGAGKSQVARQVVRLLRERRVDAVVVRHPMPYGDLAAQRVQRFACFEDLDRQQCTIEEREEYEPHLASGTTVHAGVDYAAVLAAAEQESEVIVWDGGNNDFPFFRPDLLITVADPLRAGDETAYYPGEVNLRMADVVIVNKIDSAAPAAVGALRESIAVCNPAARVIDAESPLAVDRPEAITGRRCLIVEDGPTITHGQMRVGAGAVAAHRLGAAEIVDPRPWLVGRLRQTFAAYPAIGPVLPAMGYSDEQIGDLDATIAAADCESVVVATPIDLSRLLRIGRPVARVSYAYREPGGAAQLAEVVSEFCRRHELGAAPRDDRGSCRM
ncbi:cyclic 2,3-diphosphoglycerate synthase [Accumulibacter sp.]|uniref:cyclic 2,3-diphosphoglycerate synthase n=1 Tax=Accumulibacter sp. TaxID=2053492 RepID=UPI0025F996C6|nr:cyclic 2,3-diphosphoglycerate synthase [Accumulibacter sp.]MCM8595583.1 cyclic 2,3-diphosphoglycerate synthase [Accumulibacter sp.]MCM8624859.1 cyclic 2,3-diphosphoglycerate synthase [Accumulibacter sp.]MDS4049731.1 cyclic 2,3-diphosphoglycerate synthase [Accumulibacter sp.]